MDWVKYYTTETVGRIGTTSTDVRNLKNRVDPDIESTNRDINAPGCNIDPNTRQAWLAFYASWKQYYGSDDSWWFGFGTGGIYDAGLSYEQQLMAWQAKIKETCKLSAPEHKPSENEKSGLPEGVTTVAVAAAVIAAALLLSKLKS